MLEFKTITDDEVLIVLLKYYKNKRDEKLCTFLPYVEERITEVERMLEERK